MTNIKKDSAVWRSLVTAAQALFTFFIGLAVVVINVPGVTDAVTNYTKSHIGEMFLAVGIPMAFGTGLMSFLFNWLLRRDVKTI